MGRGGIIDPAFVCVTCLLLAADIFPPRATRPGHPRRRAELSRDGSAVVGRNGSEKRRKKGGGRTERVGRWKYHLSRPGLSISAALIR